MKAAYFTAFCFLLQIFHCYGNHHDEDITVSREVIFPPGTEEFPKDSCLILFIQKAIQCFLCHNPKLSETKIVDLTLTNNKIAYSLKLPKSISSGPYSISATLNVGWCKTVSSNDWIRRGDFKQKYGNYFTIDNSLHNIEGPSIKMEMYGRPQKYIAPPRPQTCVQNGKNYAVGATFIPENCEGICTCETDGNVGCVPMCPPSAVECVPGERIELYKEKVANSQCTCDRERCVKEDDSCIYKGRKYSAGDEFIGDNCQGRCSCGDDSIVSCVSLCPQQLVECPPNDRVEIYKENVLESQCQCEMQRCVKVSSGPILPSCQHLGKRYALSETFIDDKCESRCQCKDNGRVDCLPLCPLSFAECLPGQQIQTVDVPVTQSSCKCKREICVRDSSSPAQCFINGKGYPHGERFVPDDCSGYCRCNNDGGISCVSLCPPSQVLCSPGFKRVSYKRQVGSGECYCTRQRCEPNTNSLNKDSVQGAPEPAGSDSCHRNCARLYSPVCGSNDKTYNNLCLFENAQCLNKELTLKSSSKCDIVVTNVLECPEGVPIVACKKDPCDGLTCNGYRDAKCVSNFCGGCNADFFIGERKIKCKQPECPVGVPIVACRTDPCKQVSCSAYPNAKCVANFCGSCNAEFYLTSRKVDCSIEKCQKKQEELLLTNSGKILLGQYIPQCNVLGKYEVMQCHEGYCWCVESTSGETLVEKSERRGAVDCLKAINNPDTTKSPPTASTTAKVVPPQPNIDEDSRSVTVVGYLKFESPVKELKPGSCVYLTVRKSLHPEVISKKKMSNPNELNVRDDKIRYGIDVKDIYSGEYEIGIVVNNGWCHTSQDKNSEWIRDGDYHNTFAEIFSVRKDSNRNVLRKDARLQVMKTHPDSKSTEGPSEKLAISGNIVFKVNKEIQIKENSCLIIKVTDTIVCDEPSLCPPNKIFVKQKLFDFEIKEQRIGYQLEIEDDGRGLYRISAVLNNGWCGGDNGEWIRKGDYYNDVSHYIELTGDKKEVFKDVNVKQYGSSQQNKENTDAKQTVTILGKVNMPDDISIPLDQGSCLHIFIQEAVYCLYCDNPILSQIRIMNPKIINKKISYNLTLNLDEEVKHTSESYHMKELLIQATLNVGWCGDDNEWIRYNDFHNEFANSFDVAAKQSQINKDINLKRYQSKKPIFQDESDSASITGDVILPYGAPIHFSNQSCLTMYIQEDIQCDEYCEIPILTSFKVKDPQIIDRRIPYKMLLKKPTHGAFAIQATFNNGWCKGTGKEWIRFGDFHNDVAHNFHLETNQFSKEMDVHVGQYKNQNPLKGPDDPVRDAIQNSQIHGKVILFGDIESLPVDSCLHLTVQENIQCEFCHNPILANITMKDLTVVESNIAYKLDLPTLDLDSYIIQAKINVGKCSEINVPIQLGDYHNEDLFTFQIESKSADIVVDLDVVKYQIKDATLTKTNSLTPHKVQLLGDIQFETNNVAIPTYSCLHLTIQRDIYCDGTIPCNNPFLVKHTIRNLRIIDNKIAYKVDISHLPKDLYRLQTVIHLGRCDDIEGEGIKSGDYMNEYASVFVINDASRDIPMDIDVVKYINPDASRRSY